MKEKTIIGKLKSGEPSALGKAVEAYSGYVRTVTRNFGRGALSEEDVDEIASDVFYRLWKRRYDLNEELGLRPYLSAAARNAVKNRFRDKGGCPAALQADIDELDIPLDYCLEDDAERGEMMTCLTEGIRSLSEDEREIFVRFYFYGEKSSRIANKMNTTESNVNTRLHRIRNKLKSYLIERGFDHA